MFRRILVGSPRRPPAARRCRRPPVTAPRRRPRRRPRRGAAVLLVGALAAVSAVLALPPPAASARQAGGGVVAYTADGRIKLRSMDGGRPLDLGPGAEPRLHAGRTDPLLAVPRREHRRVGDGRRRRQPHPADDRGGHRPARRSPARTAGRWRSSRCASGSRELWVMAADGSDQRPLLPVSGSDSSPDWSPDGSPGGLRQQQPLPPVRDHLRPGARRRRPATAHLRAAVRPRAALVTGRQPGGLRLAAYRRLGDLDDGRRRLRPAPADLGGGAGRPADLDRGRQPDRLRPLLLRRQRRPVGDAGRRVRPDPADHLPAGRRGPGGLARPGRGAPRPRGGLRSRWGPASPRRPPSPWARPARAGRPRRPRRAAGTPTRTPGRPARWGAPRPSPGARR